MVGAAREEEEGRASWRGEGDWGHTVKGPVAESQCAMYYSVLGHTGVSYWVPMMEDKV